MQRALRVALTRLRHALSPKRQMRGDSTDGDACELAEMVDEHGGAVLRYWVGLRLGWRSAW
jgi:hypothetical protein